MSQEITIKQEWKPDGSTLTNADSVTLSVTRDDTGASVVAAGTVMPKVATGIYLISFPSPAPEIVLHWTVTLIYQGEPSTFSGSVKTDPLPRPGLAPLVPDEMVFLHLGVKPKEKDEKWLKMIRPGVERAIKRYLGYDPRFHRDVEYLPPDTGFKQQDPSVRDFDVRGRKLVTEVATLNEGADQLLLPRLPIREVHEIWEDRMAWGGQALGDFSPTNKLVSGVDYAIDWTEAGISRDGILRRMYMHWPVRPRTVKVDYSAGWRPEEITGGAASTIGLACLIELQYWWSRRGKRPFVINNESIGGYSVAYAKAAAAKGLTLEARRMLSEFLSYYRVM